MISLKSYSNTCANDDLIRLNKFDSWFQTSYVISFLINIWKLFPTYPTWHLQIFLSRTRRGLLVVLPFRWSKILTPTGNLPSLFFHVTSGALRAISLEGCLTYRWLEIVAHFGHRENICLLVSTLVSFRLQHLIWRV
jgi:hypothetical protein